MFSYRQSLKESKNKSGYVSQPSFAQQSKPANFSIRTFTMISLQNKAKSHKGPKRTTCNPRIHYESPKFALQNGHTGTMVKSGLVSLVLYNNIQLAHQPMSLQEEFPIFLNEEYHFYEGQAYRYQNEVEILMNKSGLDKDYMDQGPNSQMEEIIKDLVFECPIKTNTLEEFQKWDQSLPTPEIIQKHIEKTLCKKQKKIKKGRNSPFHNFQKHLNNALKRLIIVPEFHPEESPQKQAAVQIWEAYCRCEVKTKRILHFIFNERNEHMINDSELKTYGLFGIYQRFGEETVAQARTVLSKLAIDQLDRQNIQGYLKSRKLQTKDGFEEYILNFRAELENGYLKRRINIEK